MIAAEELASDAIDDVWYEKGLAEAYARALADVHEHYLAQAMRVIEAIGALEEEGAPLVGGARDLAPVRVRRRVGGARPARPPDGLSGRGILCDPRRRCHRGA